MSDRDEIDAIVKDTMEKIEKFGHANISVTNAIGCECCSTAEDSKYGGSKYYKTGTIDAGFIYTVGRRASNSPDIFFWLGGPDGHHGFTADQLKLQNAIAYSIINEECAALDAMGVLNAEDTGVYPFQSFDGVEANGFKFEFVKDKAEVTTAMNEMKFCKRFYGQEEFPVVVLKPVM